MTDVRVAIFWTETALRALRDLPDKVARGLYRKVGGLRDTDPRTAGKPLVGPLAGCFRLTYSRYRVVYRVDEERDDRGVARLVVRVTVILAGIRQQGSRRDVYELAKRLIAIAEE